MIQEESCNTVSPSIMDSLFEAWRNAAPSLSGPSVVERGLASEVQHQTLVTCPPCIDAAPYYSDGVFSTLYGRHGIHWLRTLGVTY